MKKYFALVKLLFGLQYRIKPTDSKKKRGGTIAAFIVIGLCFLPMLAGIAVATFYMGQVTRGDVNVASILIFVCQGLVLLFGVFSMMTTVFASKDADKLLFLPVGSTTIFAAKLTVQYVNEVITTAVAVLVTLLPFGIGAGASALYYFMLIPALVLIPLLPMLVGCIVTIPLSALINKIGKNGVLKTVLQVLVFVVIFVGYIVLYYELGLSAAYTDETDGAQMAENLLKNLQATAQNMKYLHSDFTLASAMLAKDAGTFFLSLLISVAENALLFAIVIAMSLPFYHWILTTSTEGVGIGSRKKKAKAQDLQVKNQGVIRQLITTDIKRISRDGQMGFQCFGALIMLPIMVAAFYLIFTLDTEEGGILDLQIYPLYQHIASLIFVAYMSMLGMVTNMLGIYPVSRENKSLYLIKSLPVPFNKYLLAKVVLATAVMLIADFITCLLVVILFGIKWYYGIAMLIVMMLLGFGAMCITTLIDLKAPKLGWTNFNQTFKNAKNSWLTMLISLGVTVVLAAASSGFIVWAASDTGWYVPLTMWIVIIGLSAGFAAVCYKIMTSNAEEYFNRIEP